MDENKDLQQEKSNKSKLVGSSKSDNSIRNRQTSVNASQKNSSVDNKEKKEKKKRVKKEHPKMRKFGIILCSLCLVGLISVSTVGLYVLKYMTDFVNGEVAIDLDEYKANQGQTTILYTLDSDGMRLRSQDFTVRKIVFGLTLMRCLLICKTHLLLLKIPDSKNIPVSIGEEQYQL